MASTNNEVCFLGLRKDIERYASIGDYAHTMALIEKAMPLCNKIYSETSDQDKKNVMRQNAEKLKNMYAVCKKKLGGEEELTYDAPQKKQPEKASASKPASKTEKKQSEKAKGDNGAQKDINYIFEGVNVKDFIVEESNEVVTFSDVKGMEKEKKLIEREFFLDETDRAFNEFFGKKSKTFILLYGVPGTGKTFFAKAISYELKAQLGGDVPFFSVVGSQLSDCKVGSSEKNIRAVFEFCKQFEHCVLFIDEFDTLAPDRKIVSGDPTAKDRVTTLLQMIDGFNSAKGTLLIAATNCPYNLDGAILSRVNEKIEIPLPNYDVIIGTLSAKIGKAVAADVDLPALANKLKGYSNRDIKNFMEVLKDMLFDEFRSLKQKGETRPFEELKYTNEMIVKALKTVVPTTKQSDVDRIEKFKLLGE